MLIVWDSIASMVTESGGGRSAGDRRVGDVPLLMSEELKKIVPLLAKSRAVLIGVNQVRAKIGVMFGDNTTTPGGNAPKFYSSQRLQILGGKAVKNAKGEHTAKIVTMMAVKNRFGSPFRKARVRLDFDSGFNNIWSTVWHAKIQKLIKARKGGFAGPSREGLAVYKEATRKLGWTTGRDFAVQEDDLEIDIDDITIEDTDD